MLFLALGVGSGDTKAVTDPEWIRCRAEADRGIAEAQYRLGKMYAEGQGVPRDDAQAYKWLLRASEQGLLDARLRLGLLHEAEGPLQNFTEAIRWYRLSAEGNYGLAEYRLGCLYFQGCGVDRDLEQAHRWLSLAAHHGLPCEKPLRNAYSCEEAEILYRFGAERGSAGAQFHLAALYESEDSSLFNLAEATKWFKTAAEHGHEDAQFRLACIYANYEPINYGEALHWCRKAADAGVAGAQFTLGKIYETGEYDIDIDLWEARKWYALAADQGHEEAATELGRVEENIISLRVITPLEDQGTRYELLLPVRKGQEQSVLKETSAKR